MTKYGTILTSSSTPSEPTNSFYDCIHRAKARGASLLAMRRPWRQLVDPCSFGLPAYSRLCKSLNYFRMNYAIITFLIVSLFLLWHPISLIVFIVIVIAWLFLYFLIDESLVLCGREINDSVVLTVLAVVTLVLILLTKSTENILVNLLIGVVVVVSHASLSIAEEIYQEEEAVEHRRWYNFLF